MILQKWNKNTRRSNRCIVQGMAVYRVALLVNTAYICTTRLEVMQIRRRMRLSVAATARHPGFYIILLIRVYDKKKPPDKVKLHTVVLSPWRFADPPPEQRYHHRNKDKKQGIEKISRQLYPLGRINLPPGRKLPG